MSIENVQRLATRMLKVLTGLEYTDILIRLGIPMLEYRRTRADVIETYKLMHILDKTATRMLIVRDNAVTKGHYQKLI